MDRFILSGVLGRRVGWLGAGLVVGLVSAALIAQGALARPGPPAVSAAPELVKPAPVALDTAQALLPALLPAVAESLAGETILAVSESADSATEATAGPPVVSHHRLAFVPFRTQRDGSPYAGSNCGPAALAMVLESYGIREENDQLRYLTHSYQGTWPRRGGTALQHMAQVGIDYGLQAGGLYEGDAFRHWTVADVRGEIEQGHPVIALVKYRLLPGREYSPVRYDHYVVLWDLTPDGFVYNDPIYPAGDEGYARFMTNAQLDAAMAPTMEPRQAVAFY